MFAEISDIKVVPELSFQFLEVRLQGPCPTNSQIYPQLLRKDLTYLQQCKTAATCCLSPNTSAWEDKQMWLAKITALSEEQLGV